MLDGQASVTIMIVSYNTVDVLRDCLRSVLSACRPTDEVIVVDNASTDGTAEMVRTTFSTVVLISNRANLGFAVAADQGVGLAGRELCLVLNPDTQIDAAALDELRASVARHQGRAMIGPRLLNADGTLQRSAFRFPSPRVLLEEQLNIAPRVRARVQRDRDGCFEVDWLKGACLIASTSLLRRYGPFDGRFFMFGEDADLCRRLWNDGVPVLYNPAATIVHLGGMSTRQQPRRMTFLFIESTYRFYRDHYSRRQLFLASAVLRSAAMLKAGVAVVRWARASLVRDGQTADRQWSAVGTFLRVLTVEPTPDAEGSAFLEMQGVVGQVAPAPEVVEHQEPATAQGKSVAVPADSVAGPAASPPLSAPTVPAAQGSVALLGSFAVIAVLNYAFAFLMSSLLPVEQFGVLGIVQAILLLGSTLVGAGFPWALAALVARLTDRDERGRAFRSALIGNLALGALVAALVGAAGFGGLFGAPIVYMNVLVAAALTVAVLALNAILTAALQGLLRLRELAVVRTVEVTIKVIVGSILVVLGLQALGALVGFLVGAVVSTALAAILIRDFHIGSKHGLGDRRVYSTATPIFVAMFGLAVLSQADILTLKLFTNGAQSEFLAGQYQVAVTLGRLPFFAASALLGAVFPYLARSGGSGPAARAYAQRAVKYIFLFVIPFSIACMVIPTGLIRTFFSAKYDDAAQPLVYVAGATILLMLTYAATLSLLARGRPGLPAVALTLAMGVQAVAATILVPALNGVGAALALGIATAVALVISGGSVILGYRLFPNGRALLAYGISVTSFAATLLLLPHAERFQTLVALVTAGIVYAAALLLTHLLTSVDINIVGGAFGARGRNLMSRLAGLVDMLRT